MMRMILAALVAGVLSGLFATAIQQVRVTPLILAAESYENGEDAHSTGTHSHSHSHSHSHGASDEGDAPSVWGPSEGFERHFFTGLSNVLAGTAFSLLLLGGVLLTRSKLNFQQGIVWGFCGFLAFVLAPNFGLPPELPGMQAADLTMRQLWWVATVSATAIALLIFAFRQKLIWLLFGLALLLAPHIYGAPTPASHESNVPANLAAEFAIATIVTSLLFWLFLGAVLGWLIARAERVEEREQQQEALRAPHEPAA